MSDIAMFQQLRVAVSVYVAEEINEGNRTRSGCSEPPFGSSSGGDDGEHDHSQQYEPTERTYYVQNGTQIDHPSRNKHYQPIESDACDADPPRNADSTVLRRVHCSPLYQQSASCGRQPSRTGISLKSPQGSQMSLIGMLRQLTEGNLHGRFRII
jgi:hypothetical protein